MIDLQYRTFRLDDNAVDAEGHFTGHSSVFGVEDSYGTYFDKGCFKRTIKHHGGQFPILWFHNPTEPICLAAHSEDDTGLFVEGDLDLDIEIGRRIRSGMLHGYIDCMSIGFRPVSEVLKDEKTHFTECKLWESSLLTRNFAAMPGADVEDIRMMRDAMTHITEGDGIESAEQLAGAVADLRVMLDAMFDRGVNGAANLPLADRDHAWSKAQAEKRVRKWAGADEEPNAKYRKAFFWFDGEEPKEFGSYKLLFADVIDGELTAIPRAIFAVAGVLMGARGGVDIPAADKEGVKRRVERYYAAMRKKFDDDDIIPPWQRSSQIEVVRALTGAIGDLGPALALAQGSPVGTPGEGDPPGTAVYADLYSRLEALHA